jgi:hypothetical protein
MRASRRAALGLVLLAGLACAHGARADGLPPLRLASRRALPPGAPGTLEHAIASYKPKHVRPVDEGTLPSPRAGATCPPDMANVDERFCVDRYEGSLAEKLPNGALAPHSPYEPPEDGHVYVARSVAGVLPQAYVSAEQADAACHQVGKRLCQAVEWRVACGGMQGYAWSYGPRREPGKCNDSGKPPLLALFPPTGPKWKGWGLVELNDPRADQMDHTLAKTGEHAGCVNDLGIHDMVGNLHEWTADPNGTFQGGYFLDTTVNGEGCAYRTTAHHFRYHDYSTGFRCCADPK